MFWQPKGRRILEQNSHFSISHDQKTGQYARKVATAKVNEAPKPQRGSPKNPDPPNQVKDRLSTPQRQWSQNARPPKTPLQETNFTRETYKKIVICPETRAPNCAEQFGGASFYFFWHQKQGAPTDPWGDMRGRWTEKMCYSAQPGLAKIMKPCRLRNGSSFGRAFLALGSTI